MSALTDLQAINARILAAADNIADDVRRLTEKIGTGMSEADVTTAKAEGEAIASKLEGIAAQTPEN